MHNAEHRGVRANAQRECQHRNACKAWALAERAGAIPQVLPQYVQPGESPHLPRDFFQACNVAESSARRVASIRCLHSRRAVLLLAYRQMKRKLILQVPIELLAPPQQLNSQPELPGPTFCNVTLICRL